ncbi:MAG: aminodeoxychorismate synthase component I [Thiohalocapsa sp.]|jgi:para-aminobenzoate synthetase component 1|uniref:aminodeoxychorismate synthase component I n=1 Tax=Thiohalocapsa sp. TaxID=2497641 RepID=UPI0025F2786E|nr:aminodeoxychorismate synthase component I [Thiohalocapsa sp.]MCG6941038.1 aminodeoxychorismate synthase component I [Thiohalocapsa sp.]
MKDATRIEQLSYRADAAALFGAAAAEPWAVLLDSNAHHAGGGRWDILALAPRATLHTVGAVTEIRTGNRRRRSRADPLHLLREAIGPRVYSAAAAEPGLPFIGGAIGWLGYDLGRRLERLGLQAPLPAGAPQMAVGIYDWALLVDHHARAAYLVGQGSPADPRRQRLLRLAQEWEPAPCLPFRVTGPLLSDMDQTDYARRFAAVQDYIRAGDCYQVNLARRWQAPCAGDPWSAYRVLRQLNPAPFAAYLNTPGMQVLSASPERFLSLRDGLVETRPIKGTAARDPNPARDRALAAGLAASAKDRAENLMIVDLLRNDLGRCCETASIRVPELFKVESYAGVHHLVSTVTGRLRADADAAALLCGCFPGGSITGAPKIRSMQIIDELERAPRGVYCGSIGYIGFDGAMDTNIAIRTATVCNGRLDFRAGGGLVVDSDCDAEWAEIGLKARAMLELVGAVSGDAWPALGRDRGAVAWRSDLV